MCTFAALVIRKIATSYHINKPDIATIGHTLVTQNGDDDPLVLWKCHSQKFQLLSQVA